MSTTQETQKHTAHVSQEATVIGRDSLRSCCTCGWYGTPFLNDPDGYRDAWREGREHQRTGSLYVGAVPPSSPGFYHGRAS
jgi:hypothetical protein